jgi:hypothetical protein
MGIVILLKHKNKQLLPDFSMNIKNKAGYVAGFKKWEI